MNKKYMDFVPTKSTKTSVNQVRKMTKIVEEDDEEFDIDYPIPEVWAKRAVSKTTSKITYSDMPKYAPKATPKVAPKPTPKVAQKAASSDASKIAKEPEAKQEGTPVLGVVEDLNSKFVKTDIPKRPLGEGVEMNKDNELSEAKKKKIGHRRRVKAEKKSVEKPVEKFAIEDKKTFVPPKSPFINQEKVVKRPLSKNVYQKKVEVPKEEPKGPVTIITKPEKDAHVSLIVTIILTIILGAAAGTVAFLLLPK